jgi:hypothetical protein
MTALVAITLTLGTLLDPFRLIPWLLLAYFAPSRVAAVLGGVGVGFAAWLVLRMMAVGSPSSVDYFALVVGCIIGAAVPALLWSPFQRIRAKRKRPST